MRPEMPIKEIMTKNVCTARGSESLLNATKKMLEFGVGSIVVVESERPIGIVTERDIIEKVVVKNKIPEKVKLKDIMTRPVITVGPTTSLKEAINIMIKKGIRRLPVVDGGKLIGIVTDTDILGVSLELGELLDLLREKSPVKETFSGICDKCGVFSDKLIDVDGLRLCEDCFESSYE